MLRGTKSEIFLGLQDPFLPTMQCTLHTHVAANAELFWFLLSDAGLLSTLYCSRSCLSAGASLTSWLRTGPQVSTDVLDSSQLNPDEGTESCGTRSSASDLGDLLREQSGSWQPPEQSPAPQQPLGGVPGRKDAEKLGPQHDCPTSTIEAQLQRLWLVEEKAFSWPAPCVQPEQVELDIHPVVGSTPPAADNPCGSQGAPLDGTAGADFSGLLERDFSVHSLTSVVNEDCFYDKSERVAPCAQTSSAEASSCSPD